MNECTLTQVLNHTTQILFYKQNKIFPKKFREIRLTPRVIADGIRLQCSDSDKSVLLNEIRAKGEQSEEFSNFVKGWIPSSTRPLGQDIKIKIFKYIL